MRSFQSSQSIKPVKRFISSKNFIYIIGIALLATMWQVLSFYIGEDTMIFPGPVSTLRYAFYLLGKEYTYRCIFFTMCRMLTGFVFSLAAGLVLGIFAGNFEAFGDLLRPSIIMLRAIPTASLVYLFIVLAGFKNAPIYLVFLISFPIIYEGVKTGVANVSPAIINATRLDGASFIRENLRIRLPLAFPYIAAAMASAFSLCFKIEIMAEVITGSSVAGLGSAILGVRSSDPTNMIPVFGYSAIAVALMLVIDQLASLIRDKIRVN